MNFNLANWQQKQVMDAYTDQREVEKARAKAIAREQVKMQAREYREVQREQEGKKRFTRKFRFYKMGSYK